MGKGDKKSKRGKITNGSYGKKRARKSVSAIPVKVLDKDNDKALKSTVEKKATKPKNTTDNAEVKPKVIRKKKTEE